MALCLLVLLCACGAQEAGEEEDTPPATQEQASKPLDTSVIQGREGELDFAFSLEDWIAAYNVQYQEGMGEALLTPPETWSSLRFATAPHSQQETVFYEFLADERM